MKRYQDYKNQFKIILILGILLLIPLAFSVAQTKEELNSKISQKSSEIDKLNQEIAQYQKELNSLGKEKNSLSNSIKELDLTKKKLNADISITENKIDKTNLEIASLSGQIITKEDAIDNHFKSIALGIRQTNEFEQNSLIEIILSKNDFSSIWNDLDNVLTTRERIRERIEELKKIKGDLEYSKAETTQAKNELIILKNKLSDQKKLVDQNKKEKDNLLAQTKNSESNYQKLLKDRIAKKDAFEKELEDYESQLKYILDSSSLPTTRVLSWPLDNIYVTSPYGPRWGKIHRGTDFRASVGTPVKSMADGIIKGVGDTDICCSGASFGKWIFIEYNNGLSSTYGHLSLIKVTKGQKVSRGEIVGYSGNTGSSTGPHLHVSVYASSGVEVGSFESKAYPGRTLVQPISATNAHLDPMNYLPIYKN